MDEWAARALSFGVVAEEYDRFRPGYPDALYDDVLALAPATPRVLEAGAGTGRATLALARRGARVTAVEPDPAMAAVARREAAGPAVDVVVEPFEEHDPAPCDVVASAQAWHWIDPVRGTGVAARALGEGGLLALWWNRPGTTAGSLYDAIDAAYARHAPELHDTAAGRPRSHARAQGRELGPAAGFSAWQWRSYDWTDHLDTAAYVGLHRTASDHIRLPADRRERLLTAVGAAIDDLGGGAIDRPYRTVLALARRA